MLSRTQVPTQHLIIIILFTKRLWHLSIEHVYLASELVPGADLGFHLKKRKFKEEQAKFIIASIIVGLEYLHNNNIIHRNVTPSNILIDKKGYVKLSDFILAREWDKNNASDTSGTPGYMAPEVMWRQNHSFSSDYFALGVIGYQFMLRKKPYRYILINMSPYRGVTREEVISQIKEKQVLVFNPFPVPLSDLIHI